MSPTLQICRLFDLVFSRAHRARTVPELLALWQERTEQRHRFAEADDRLLKDIGLSRADVVRETGKPFWRA
ncbi:MAG: DUF1127 domain-containing protein [Alphaproteobacteria bacterium]